MAKKPSMGRQKIKIAKIEIKNHLQVTFSKRRSGLFKKASELCILCGVEIAIIVFSPAGKVFSFGHPNVEPIVDRFLSRVPHPVSNAVGGSSAGVPEMNIQLTQIMAESEVEKKRGEILENIRKERRRQYWWEAPISELGLIELEQVINAMDELKKNVGAQIGRIMAEAVNNTTPIFLAMNNGMAFDLIEETKPQTIMFNFNNTHQTFGFDHGFL